MLASLSSNLRAKRPFCSATTLLHLRSTRPSSHTKAPVKGDTAASIASSKTAHAASEAVTGDQDTANASRSRLFGFSQPAPNTSSISPADISYSRFLSRHGPLEVANRLLHPQSQTSTKALSLRQRQQAAQRARAAASGAEHLADLDEAVIWQSATGAELELARIPQAALRALQAAAQRAGPTVTRGRTSAQWWSPSASKADASANSMTRSAPASRFASAVRHAMEQHAQREEAEDAAAEQEQQQQQEQQNQEEDVQEVPANNKADRLAQMNRVVVVPFAGNTGNAQEFYENLMTAVESGLRRVESYSMTSTKRKRRLKMNKHKFKKRRKEQESMRKKLDK